MAIFVEDEFAKQWLVTSARERIGTDIDQIGIYAVGGDGSAIKTHRAHTLNPAVSFRSLCVLDGDSRQAEAPSEGVHRLPGALPETTVFNGVLRNIKNNIALLTVACQRPIDRQSEVAAVIEAVSQTNRDPHLLFAQVGEKLGFIPEATIRGAFLAIWVQENGGAVDMMVEPIRNALREESNKASAR